MGRLNANLSDEAHDGWRQMDALYGVSMTALAEAIGLRLARLDRPEHKLPPIWRELISEARAIKAEHSARG